MKVFVTGATGFIGLHLCRFLREKGAKVYGAIHKKSQRVGGPDYINIDLLSKKDVLKFIKEICPDYIIHLAAQSLVIPSWQNPEQTLQTNIFSTLYLLEVMVKVKSNARILLFGSSSEYDQNEKKIHEDSPLFPSSPYAISKLAQDYLGLLYHKAYGLNVVVIRPFFIIGSGKTGDVVSDFVRGIIDIEKGHESVLYVGNTDAVRDFLDVKDAVDGVYVIMKHGESGQVYNLCSGIPTKVGKVLNILIANSKEKVNLVKDKNKLRAVDEKIKVGDNLKLRQLGWRKSVPLDKSLKQILDYWRNV